MQILTQLTTTKVQTLTLFTTELTAKQRRCNQLQLEVFRRETMMLKAGSDKEALWAELQELLNPKP